MKDDKMLSKKSIYAAIFGAFLAFIISKLFTPIFEKLYSLFLTLGGSVIKSISNSTYQKISDGFTEQNSQFVLYVLCIFVCFAFSYYNYLLTEKTKESQELIDSALNPPHKNNPKEDLDSLTLEELKTKYDEDINFYRKTQKRVKITFIFGKVFTIIFFCLFLYKYGQQTFINSKITATTNNIEIVSPYISDKDYKQLKSDFHKIRNSEDYETLNRVLNKIAHANSIVLKK